MAPGSEGCFIRMSSRVPWWRVCHHGVGLGRCCGVKLYRLDIPEPAQLSWLFW